MILWKILQIWEQCNYMTTIGNFPNDFVKDPPNLGAMQLYNYNRLFSKDFAKITPNSGAMYIYDYNR